MAIGWMTALKLIPWAGVLESAPHIVKAARRLFTETRAGATTADSSDNSSEGDNPASPNARMRQLEARIVELSDEQKLSAELIKSLAEQNARIVEVIEALRVRTRILLVTCVALGSVLAGLLFWLIMR